MCRYAIYYKEHFVCFRCRKVFRYHRATTCPQCGERLVAIGRDFRAPKQTAKEQWEVVEILYRHGVVFHSCGCSGPGYRPTRLKDVPAFLSSLQSQK